MGDAAWHFYRESELRRRFIPPARVSRAAMRPIERGIDLNAGEVSRIIGEMRLSRRAVSTQRGRITPSGDANTNPAQCCDISPQGEMTRLISCSASNQSSSAWPASKSRFSARKYAASAIMRCHSGSVGGSNEGRARICLSGGILIAMSSQCPHTQILSHDHSPFLPCSLSAIF